ncbi:MULTISPECIES: serine/threonine-protein kinase [Cyanophyceae]|uniref:serine/threonine-protein kinase n=1 Tax=Cyanophyceae TaxID=3028117 RepID=UPI00232EC2DB|nr:MULTISPECIES: serine/threonine-protein kinase [Cyanophyceae]MDB9354978.1 tetratricopeptide repeat protein [Nodularia spumigena CS-587/03]MDB9305831.1 tetratricopeptide repeat protein [Nodularia spumigena CS-591/12]MDB9340496.1 tetratricopeptide repeat protein [Nodularia spumigena CS-589/07]MDB9345488.1 tetratricopeptide repeat protein [Nodularia spumigena CS-588/06]MDB9371157.1 tetratricopeptide repeat protein [Nodularia spumigena CS-586/05]
MLGNTLVGRYQIISHLGGGGFGETFVACDTHLPGLPQCVVKKLKPQATDPVNLETARRLFDTEAQVLYKLGIHDRIPQLLAYFEENAEFYLVQEFIPGHNLSQELTPGKIFSPEEVISLIQEILAILEFVHQEKVIHRDVNPQNLLRREEDGKLVLIDFGAVKQIATQIINPQGETKSTVAIGTPGYLPGEQAQGTPKFSSDIYAVGIIAIQALTGLSATQLEVDIDTNEIIWQNQASVSPEFAQFIDKMVCYDFRQRYASATVALQKLQEFMQLSSGTIVVSPPLGLNSGLSLKPDPPLQNFKLNKYKKAILIKLSLAIFVIGASGIASVFIVNSINAHNAIALSEQGSTLFELQRYQDALAAYQEAVSISPDYVPGWNGQGKTLSQLKKYEEALAAYDQAIQIQPDYVEAWSGRGFVLRDLQRYPEAIASFEKALQLDNTAPEIWNAKGEIFRNLQQYNNAIQSYDQALELQPNYYQAWYSKGLAFHNLKQYDDAINAYETAIEFKPDYGQAWYSLGNALFNLNRFDYALKAYDKAVQYRPKFYPAWFSRSNILITLRRYPQAIESFEQALKHNPNDYQSWYSRGWALHQSQRYEEAIQSYNKAAAIKRNDYQVWYNLGNSQYILQKYQQAIASYDKAVRYQTNHAESWYSRGNALLNLQRYKEAIESYDQAIKYKPNYREAINARNEAQKELSVEKPQPIIVPTIPNYED